MQFESLLHPDLQMAVWTLTMCQPLLQDENGRRPQPYDRDDAANLIQHAQKINEHASNKVDVDEVQSLAHFNCTCLVGHLTSHFLVIKHTAKASAGRVQHKLFLPLVNVVLFS